MQAILCDGCQQVIHPHEMASAISLEVSDVRLNRYDGPPRHVRANLDLHNPVCLGMIVGMWREQRGPFAPPAKRAGGAPSAVGGAS